MTLGLFSKYQSFLIASVGILMLFLMTCDNTQGTDLASKNAEKLIEQAHEIAPLISATELKELIDSNQTFVLVDIRSEAEYTEGHLLNALLVPRSVLEFAVLNNRFGNDQSNIILYCRSGNRSALAVKDMLDLGFTNIKHLDGGFKAWFDEGFSFYNSHGEIKGLVFEKEEN